MSSLATRLAAIGTVLLALGIAAVLVLRSLGVSFGVGTAATPSPSPSPLASPSGSAGATPDEQAVLAQIEDQVRRLRGLPAAEIGPPEILSKAQLSAELARIFQRDYPAEERTADNALLRALGLLGADADIGALTEQLYSEQVLGFYDFDAKRMVVVSETGLDPQARITYAHEYTHALQDAAFDTGAAHASVIGDDDATMARLGLEEGDATLAMIIWALANLTPEEQLGVSNTPIPDMRGIPAWMVRQLEFPYLAGSTFVGQLYVSGGWDAVNAAYDDPPASTEQLLHPDKYAADEAPLAVPTPEVATGLEAEFGGGWETTQASTLGEAMIGIWLGGIGVGEDEAATAAAGWGGDALTLAMSAGGDWVLTLHIAWDAPAQADEFEASYGAISAGLPFAARVVRIDATDTVVIQSNLGPMLDAAQAEVTP
jgi:hypothetical protein